MHPGWGNRFGSLLGPRGSFITHLLSCWRRSDLWVEMKWKLWQTFVQHVCRRSPSWRNLIGWNQPREPRISKRSAPPTLQSSSIGLPVQACLPVCCRRMSRWKEILKPLCTAAAAPKHSFITTPIFYVNAGDLETIASSTIECWSPVLRKPWQSFIEWAIIYWLLATIY